MFLDKLGPGYIAEAFRRAAAADPHAQLFYNDYGAEDRGAKSDRVYQLVKDLKAGGVPIHGVGLQRHLNAAQLPPYDDIAWNMDRLIALGLKVHISCSSFLRVPPGAEFFGAYRKLRFNAAVRAGSSGLAPCWGRGRIPRRTAVVGDLARLDAAVSVRTDALQAPDGQPLRVGVAQQHAVRGRHAFAFARSPLQPTCDGTWDRRWFVRN